VLIAQLSDIHVGGSRYEDALLRRAIDEINGERPDLVAVAGDLTGGGYEDEFRGAKEALAQLECARVVVVPGNHDARNVGYLRFEEHFCERYTRHRFECDGLDVALVAADSSEPDIDEGEIGRDRYVFLHEGFPAEAGLRVFVIHHHLVSIPGTGRERNQLLDAGDVLALLLDDCVDLVLAGHRHVPYVWPIAGTLVVHSGTASTRRVRRFAEPAYNLLRIDESSIEVELCVTGGARQTLGRYPRRWPADLAGRRMDPWAESHPPAPPGAG
jgi:3',5'-cyclic AMP phosphodiesterase CpdA